MYYDKNSEITNNKHFALKFIDMISFEQNQKRISRTDSFVLSLKDKMTSINRCDHNNCFSLGYFVICSLRTNVSFLIKFNQI
jgi:hypothetical protein